MKETIEQVINFAKAWTLDLEIAYDVDWAGHRVHCIKMADNDQDEGDTNRVFFWVMPEDENLCFYAPVELTAAELAHKYCLELQEKDWEDVPENMRAVCMNIHNIRLDNSIYKGFMRYVLDVRAQQLGSKISKVVDAPIGGCMSR